MHLFASTSLTSRKYLLLVRVDVRAFKKILGAYGKPAKIIHLMDKFYMNILSAAGSLIALYQSLWK